MPSQPKRNQKPTRVKPTKPKRATINKASAEGGNIVGYWKGDKATELTRFIDMQFHKDGTGKREGELFKWDLEDYKSLTVSWLGLVKSSKYIKIMNDAESMQTLSKKMKVYVVGGKKVTIVELNDKYYEVKSKDTYNVITLTSTSLKLSFKTAKGQTVRMSHKKQ